MGDMLDGGHAGWGMQEAHMLEEACRRGMVHGACYMRLHS